MKRLGIYITLVVLIAGVAGCTTPVADESVRYDLTVSSTEGGEVPTPGEGVFAYDEGTTVELVAEAEDGYQFVNWIGDVDTIANTNAASTVITMNGDYFVTASFEETPPVEYTLTISSTGGGLVRDPGQGEFTYDAGTVIALVASAEEGYSFVSWTGDIGTVADRHAVSTTITMNGHYSVTANFEQIPPDESCQGLVSRWRADGDATDCCGNSSGVLMNGATFAVGKVGQAFQLDGMDDWVMVPSARSLNFGTEDFTVCLWVNFADPEPEQVMIEKYVETFGSPERSGWTFTKLSDSVIRLHLGPGPDSILDAPASITADTWHFAAVSRSGNIYSIYWDGTLIGFASWTENFNLDSDVSLKIGHRGNPDDTPGSTDWRDFYLGGLVDEVQIYNVALSDADILYMFNNPGVCPGPAA